MADARIVPRWQNEPELTPKPPPPHDPAVDHPDHYNAHPSGVECITVVEHMSFLRGNAMKYLWRAGEKGDPIVDLKKAMWYIEREIINLETKKR